MTTTRLTLPTFAALTDAELQQWLRIDPDSDNLTTSMLLSSATEVVEGLTGLTIRQADYQIVTTADCSGFVRLPIGPVQSVSSVQSPDLTGTLQPLTGWTFSDRCLIVPLPLYGPLTITLTAGYPTLASIPDSVRHAIAVIVAGAYDSRSEIDDQTMTTVTRLVSSHRWYGL